MIAAHPSLEKPITSKAASGEIQIEKTNLVAYKTYYTFISGLSCHYMKDDENTDVLVCFFTIEQEFYAYSSDYYLVVDYFSAEETKNRWRKR